MENSLKDMEEIMSRIIRLGEVEHKTGLKKSKIYQMMNDGDFPKAVKLGPRSVGWFEDETDEWIENLPRVKVKII